MCVPALEFLNQLIHTPTLVITVSEYEPDWLKQKMTVLCNILSQKVWIILQEKKRTRSSSLILL